LITQDYNVVLDFSATDVLRPVGSIILHDSLLYGMCLGGTHDGVVYSVKTDGSEFTKIIDSDGNNTGRYGCSITISDSVLYGVTRQGGPNDNGVLFRADLDGSDLQTLHTFDWGTGIIPVGSLIVRDSIIFGLTELGGPTNSSAIAYRISTNGSDYSIFIDFGDPEFSTSGRIKATSRSIHINGSLSSTEDALYLAGYMTDGTNRDSRILKFSLYPDLQASGIQFSNVENNSMTLSWTRGNGLYCAVFGKEGISEISVPEDGTTYTANSLLGGGTQISGSGWYCIYNGTSSTNDVTGLNRNTQYTFAVFEYSTLTGMPKYLVDTAEGNPASKTTTDVDLPPSVQATAVIFGGIETNQITVSWTRGDGAHCALFVKENSSENVLPIDGTLYADSADYGSGDQVGQTGWYCIYNGEAATSQVTGLTENTSYQFMVCEYNDGSEGPVYKTSAATGNPASQSTIVTGLSPYSEETIALYPNPADRHIYMSINEPDRYIVQIYNARGTRLVVSQRVKGESLDISYLSPGLYILVINNQRLKFIKR
jgi:uncharacterized repeat protein (TIGR03803 family)